MIRPVLLFLSLALIPPFAAAAELLVGNKSADTVWRLSTQDGRKLGEFATGQGPHEIVVSADGRTALVSNYGAGSPGNTVSVPDLPAGKGVRTIDLGEHDRPHGMRFLPGDKRAVVTTEGSRKLLLLDVAGGRVESAIDLGEGRGHMVAVSGDGQVAYVTKIDAGTVTRVDLQKPGKTHEVTAGAGAEGVAVRLGDGEVWVSNREAGDRARIVD
jgi:DNA-binding beta-propeller fold protein YncE